MGGCLRRPWPASPAPSTSRAVPEPQSAGRRRWRGSCLPCCVAGTDGGYLIAAFRETIHETDVVAPNGEWCSPFPPADARVCVNRFAESRCLGRFRPTERRRSRTYRAVGYTTALVLKTNWATGPMPLRNEPSAGVFQCWLTTRCRPSRALPGGRLTATRTFAVWLGKAAPETAGRCLRSQGGGSRGNHGFPAEAGVDSL